MFPVNYQYVGGDVIIGMDEGPVLRSIAGGAVVGLGVDNANSADPLWAVLVLGRAGEVGLDEHADFQHLGLAAPPGITHSR